MNSIIVFIFGITLFSYWIGRYAPAWSGAFLLFLPLQAIGLLWSDPPFISQEVSWLSGLTITSITALLLTLTVLIFRLGLPWTGKLLPLSSGFAGEKIPAILFCIPVTMLGVLRVLPGENSVFAVAFYGCSYLSLSFLLVSFFEWIVRRHRTVSVFLVILYQFILLAFALFRGVTEFALLLARFSTPVFAGILTLYLVFQPPKRRGLLLALLILTISLVSMGLISYAGAEDNLAVLLYSAYNKGLSGGGRDTLLGGALAIAGKLVARQDYNEMLRSLTTLDYRFLVDSFDGIRYSLDSVLRLVGVRGYEHPLGQILFFLREESRSLEFFPSANIPIGVVVALLSRQSLPMLLLISGIYAFLFSCFLSKDYALKVSDGRLRFIVLALSGQLACLFELTPEFGLQVALMALVFLWLTLIIHRLLRGAVSQISPQGYG